MQAQSLGWGDTLEEEMATHSSILPGESHGHANVLGPFTLLECRQTSVSFYP